MLAIQEEACEFRSLLGTSPVFGRDYFAEYMPPPYLEDEVAAEVHVECGSGYLERDFLYSECITATTSCGTSVTSEISDDSFIDLNEDFDCFPDTEDTSLQFQSLQERLHDSKWSRSSTCPRQQDAHHSSSESEDDMSFNRGQKCASKISKLKSITRNSECYCCSLRKKMEKFSWKEMSSDDQMEAIEYLTRLASTTLGLREQLEIIRIINPSATVLPTDTEFVIDVDAFDDSKFQRIHQYVSQHLPRRDNCHQCSEFRRKLCRPNSSSSLTNHKHSKRSRQPLSTKRVSKKSKKAKGVLARVHKQMVKEKRSGLFQQEEVISLSASTSMECADEEEDIEIDIL